VNPVNALNFQVVEPDDSAPLHASSKKVYPRKVKGTFRRLKWMLLWLCLGVYWLPPFVRWDRKIDRFSVRDIRGLCMGRSMTLDPNHDA
jgi:hypothetical protein